MTAHVRQTEKRWLPAEDETLLPPLVSEQSLLHQRRKPPAPSATDAPAHGAEAGMAPLIRPHGRQTRLTAAVRSTYPLVTDAARISPAATIAASSHPDAPG